MLAPIILVLSLVIRILIILLIIRAVVSWVAPMSRHPTILLLDRITEPMLAPIRNAIGVHSGIDFSPLIAIVILSVIDGLLFALV